MYIEEDKYAYLTNTHYNHDYLLEGLESSPLVEKNNSFQHYGLEELNDFLRNKQENDLFALHLNAVSLVSNFDEIRSLISAKTECLPDIICISETRLKDNKIEAQTQLVNHPEYNLIYDNSSTSAGGAAIYIKIPIIIQ